MTREQTAAGERFLNAVRAIAIHEAATPNESDFKRAGVWQREYRKWYQVWKTLFHERVAAERAFRATALDDGMTDPG